MPRKPKAQPPVPFNLDDFEQVGELSTDERVVPVTDGRVLAVTLDRLTARQAKRIPYGYSVALEAAYKAAARYVRAWSWRITDAETGETREEPFTMRNGATGEVMTLPAPGSPEATPFVGEGNEWQLMEMLDNETGSQLVLWLRNPGMMLLAEKESQLGKGRETAGGSSPPSKNGATPPQSAVMAKS